MDEWLEYSKTNNEWKVDVHFKRSEKEKPINLLEYAVTRTLKMAGITKKDIQLVIYSGIDRAFIEHSNASFFAMRSE